MRQMRKLRHLDLLDENKNLAHLAALRRKGAQFGAFWGILLYVSTELK
jgi:hypothetical protein